MARWRDVEWAKQSSGSLGMTSIENGESGASVRAKLNNALARYDQDGFANVAALLADVTLAYGQVSAGDIIRTRSEGLSYRVATSGATDNNFSTAGGVKLYALGRIAAYATNAEVDLFIIYGQSNAQGQPASTVGALSWITASAEMWSGTAIVPLSNTMPVPVGGAFGGSAWPAFANEYNAQTGRRAVYVNAARGSQSIADLSKPGTNYTNMLTWVDATKAAITARGDVMGRISVLWCQGERDQALGTTYDTYRSTLAQLWTDLKVDIGATKLAIWPLGRYTSASVRQAWPVQEATLAFAMTTPDAFVAYGGVSGFSSENGMSDGVHYTMAGYNLMGRMGAKTTAAMLFDNATEDAETPRLYGQVRYSSWQRQSRASAVITRGSGGTYDWTNTRGASGSFIRSIDAATDANELRLMLAMPAQQYLEFLAEPERDGKQRGLVPCVRVISGTDSVADDYIGVSFAFQSLPIRVNMTAGTIDISSFGTAYNTAFAGMVTASFSSTGNVTLTHPEIIGLPHGSIRGDTGRQLRVNSSGTTSTIIRLRDGAGTLVNDEVTIVLPNLIVPHANIPTGYRFSVGLTFNGYAE